MRACRKPFRLICICLAAVPLIAQQAQPKPGARKALLLGVPQYQALGQAPSAEADLNLVEESLK